VAQLKNFIGGKKKASKSGRLLKDTNPADTRQVLASFPDSDARDVDAAVRAAAAAYESWHLVPPPKRGDILFRAGLLFEKEKKSLARLMTREMGKVLKEAEGDVQEAVDMAFYMAGEGRRLFGKTTTSELKNKFVMSVRQPLGVCGLITPWNFPVAIPSWKSFPALLCGNTVVLKPAEDTPATAIRFAEILTEAGLPDGVLNVVLGGPETGAALVRHPDVRLISFTGSSETGRKIAAECGRTLKRCSLELGGKNAQIVMDDADVDLALEGALWGAFGTAGQRCTATSRIYVQKKVYESFKRKMVAGARRMRLGDGMDPRVQVGPLVNADQLERVTDYVKLGEREGAKIECGGGPAKGPGLSHGYFFQPTVFTGVKPSMRIMKEEIFGPVVCIMPVSDLEDALKQINDTAYGLSSSIYTRDVNAAMKAIRDIEAGITYINGPTIGAEVHMPFGGVKDTGNGHREAGEHGLDIFSEWKSVYIDYSGKLQKAQIDTEPS
jgi:aldehyde dehydrogenase (NAD+)